MSTIDFDRTVHGIAEGAEIVRYDRSGKWYLESPLAKGRTLITVNKAAQLAAAHIANLDLPGGQRFDAIVRRIRKEFA